MPTTRGKAARRVPAHSRSRTIHTGSACYNRNFPEVMCPLLCLFSLVLAAASFRTVTKSARTAAGHCRALFSAARLSQPADARGTKRQRARRTGLAHQAGDRRPDVRGAETKANRARASGAGSGARVESRGLAHVHRAQKNGHRERVDARHDRAIGNDACLALAEVVGGSEEAFAKMMNEQAQRLGMKNTNFMNSTACQSAALFDGAGPCAVASAIIRDFPQYHPCMR